jgi:hypothetical protein
MTPKLLLIQRKRNNEKDVSNMKEQEKRTICPRRNKTLSGSAVFTGIAMFTLLWITWRWYDEFSFSNIEYEFKEHFYIYLFLPTIATIVGIYIDIIRIELGNDQITFHTITRKIVLDLKKDYLKPEPSKISNINEAKVASIYVNKKRKLFIYFDDFHENDQKIIKSVIPVKYGRNNF